MIKLTVQQFLSLQGLESPSWWQSEDLSTHTGVHSIGLLARFRQIGSSVFRIQSNRCLWEGKAVGIHHMNRTAIVVVGESQSLCHVPGVGTQWRAGGRTAIVLLRREIFRQIFDLIRLLLRPTVPVKCRRDCWIPPAPLTFSERKSQNKFISMLPLSECLKSSLESHANATIKT